MCEARAVQPSSHRTLFCVAALLAAGGCGGNQRERVGQGPGGAAASAARGVSPVVEADAAPVDAGPPPGTIGEAGGVVEGAGARVTVPAGAVHTAYVYSITRVT